MVRHLADEVGGAHQASDQPVLRVLDADVVDLHLVAGEVHQARGERRLGAEAEARQVAGDEIGPRLTWVLVNTAPFSTAASEARLR